MRIKGSSFALIASLSLLIASAWLAADFTLRASMAYYSNDPARGATMRRLEHYAVIFFVVFVLAAGASILFAIRVFRSRRQARVNRLNVTHAYSESESWVVERGGAVVAKRAQVGTAGLSDWERLVYCLWVADYMMRNAGDFANAVDMYPTFQKDAQQFAQRLGLASTYEAFSLSQQNLQKEYFDRFEQICNELRSVDPGVA
jgi:hypothetical protein